MTGLRMALLPPPKEAAFMLRTDYQLLLPEFVTESKYREVVRSCATRGDFMIMDNGAAEGAVLDSRQLYRMAGELGAQEVVVPDVLGDTIGTKAIARNWVPSENFRHMIVLTGHDAAQVLEFARFIYEELPWVTTLGLPRLLGDWGIDRSWLTGWLGSWVEEGRFELHWLGMNPHRMWEIHAMVESAMVAKLVRGYDTSAPFNYALLHKELENTYHEVVRRPRTYRFATFSPTVRTYADINAHYLLRRAYGAEAPFGSL